MLPPVLERQTADGKWEKVADAGFPAGLPRMMTLEVTGLLGGPRCDLRLRTNLHVFWDQIFVAPLLETVKPGQGRGGVRGTVLEVKDAALSARGCMKEYSPDGRKPTVYDYDRLDSFPVSRLSGPADALRRRDGTAARGRRPLRDLRRRRRAERALRRRAACRPCRRGGSAVTSCGRGATARTPRRSRRTAKRSSRCRSGR